MVGRACRGLGTAPPPAPHLLGLQEVGVPQLANDHLALLNGGLVQEWGQA